MATDFFERQSAARRSTKWLVVLFTVAVVALVGIVFVATFAAVGGYEQYSRNATISSSVEPPLAGQDFQRLQWEVPLGACAFTLLLIGGGSLFKIAQLNGGGTAVAENVGGTRVAPNTTDPIERRLLNVVEEMALASGVPVPPVFMLPEEQGINAFAAGYSPSDAVVAVTRGTAEQLTRDELQGVVAHEFSHILNGDMRLNIRLIGLLHGILLLSLVGRILFRSVAYSGRSRSKNDNVGAIIIAGLVMIIIGSVGALMGNLIKAAVSRQREFLADASAVQFTRNPGGIAGALKRIGSAVKGSLLKHPNASEMSHLYFGQGVWEGFSGLMATHPPLEKRIIRLDPAWDGTYPETPATPAALAELAGTAGLVGGAVNTVPIAVVAHAAEQVGNPTEIHREYAQELVRQLPHQIVDAVHEPYGARAVIFALLLDQDKNIRSQQMQALAQTTTLDIVELTNKLSPTISQLDARVRLPLIDMSLPALRSMTKRQYVEFSTAFQKLVQADNRIELFEWSLHRILLRHLRPQFDETAKPRIAYYGLQRLRHSCSVLLSTLAYAGNTPAEATKAVAAAAILLPKANVHLLPHEQCGLMQLEGALDDLTKVAAKHRGRLVEACAVAICADNEVKIREAELLRGISDMLDCPMPPLLPGQPVEK